MRLGLQAMERVLLSERNFNVKVTAQKTAITAHGENMTKFAALDCNNIIYYEILVIFFFINLLINKQ